LELINKINYNVLLGVLLLHLQTNIIYKTETYK